MSQIYKILKKVQMSKAAHQKQLKILRMYYDKIPLEDFFEEIRIVLRHVLSINTIYQKNCYAERILEFLAQFVADVTPEGTEDDISDECTHPFLTLIITDTLKYHNLVHEYHRYNSCLFVRLILQCIGSDKNLDNEVCDLIEEAMLERTMDPKPTVRLQAVLALIRLQDPMNAESPVNKAYLSLIVDANIQIRVEVVKNIAIYNISVLQIVNRLRDVDSNVRITAFRRCADLGPRLFKIFERQHILMCGLSESVPKVRNVFIENLLPKWLNTYENNYITFLNALKLDADENDIVNTEKITKDVLNLLFKSTPLDQFTSILPLDKNKLIPFNKLTSEAVAVWNNLTLYLRDNDNMEDYLEDLLPDLTPFCHYIESLIIEKRKNKMEDWELLDYQYILNNLLGIAENYDLSDEVGRKTLHQLTIKLLREENLLFKLKEKIVTLVEKTAQKTDDFTSIICHIISEIQEPLIEKQVEVDPNEDTNRECKKAALKVKIIVLESQLEEATDKQEYLKAESLKNEMNDVKKKLQDLSIIKPATEMIKVTKDDPKTICECLDLLICMLLLPSVNSMTPSLVAVKDEFIIPLLDSNISEINWRVIKCITLFCLIDENLVGEYLKVICIPIITYRAIPNYNKQALIAAVMAIPDMFRLYGVNVFSSIESAISVNSNQTVNSSSNKRRLYCIEESDESVIFANKFHLESIIDVMFDMLDDEICEIRNIAVEAISKLILNQFPVSSLLISRLILKWYNPLTAQASDKSQQLIGVVITNYAKSTEGAKDVIAKAVIPTLQSISNAPRTSPLAVVDADNLLLFISTITDCDEKIDVSRTHINMAHMFTSEILKKKNEGIAIYLSKLLLYLNISSESVSTLKELIAKVETALHDENLSEKTLRKNLMKFQQKLNTLLENQTQAQITNLEITENSTMVSNIKENQDDPNKVNKNKVKKNQTTTFMPLIREEDEEDIFESSQHSNTSDTNENNVNSSKSEEISNGTCINENTKKRNRKQRNMNENNTESSANNTDSDEEWHNKKKFKMPVVLLTRTKFPVNQIMAKNSDNDKEIGNVSDILSISKDSDKNNTTSEDNISATPEDEKVSKLKKRKKPSSKINILEVVTIKPQMKNAINSKTSSDSENFNKNTSCSPRLRLRSKITNKERNSKEKTSCVKRLSKNKYGSVAGNEDKDRGGTTERNFEDNDNQINRVLRSLKSNQINEKRANHVQKLDEKSSSILSKPTKQSTKTILTSDETSTDSFENIRRRKKVTSRDVVSPILKKNNKKYTSQEHCDSEITSSGKSTNDSTQSTNSSQNYNTRNNTQVANNQNKIFTNKRNIRKRKQLTVLVGHSMRKRMRLRNETNKYNSEANESKEIRSSPRVSRSEKNGHSLTPNKKTLGTRKSSKESLNQHKTSSSSSSSTTLHTILPDISQIQIFNDSTYSSKSNDNLDIVRGRKV
ncbi:condensin complex subunit 3-like isoform X2 [Diorhabda sublineata]|uniref:condensin complex subunit 3-like isoform X2 n=1 Tax=Diorhabda sublineata TaxID=1163346 RepID=UPI0024E08C48|nr:condensin complex subunit 3-like isoform X2 [Diorhabda sublineata]